MRGAEVIHLEGDVLIVGGGAAAGAAGIAAARLGGRVLLADKGMLGRSGSSPVSGDGLSPLLDPARGGDPDETREGYLRDIISGGSYLSNQRAVEVLADEGAQRVSEMVDIGIPYPRDPEGRFYNIFRVLGDRVPRAMIPLTGGHGSLTAGLRRELLHRRVQAVEDVMITRLLLHEGAVAGAVGLNIRTGTRFIFHVPAVVLAAGSATALLPYASSVFETTGDAYVLAARAGAPLVNLEFIEFTLIPTPGSRALSTGGTKPITAAGARWFNGLDEPFMTRYDPERGDLTSRARMVQANFLERQAGRGPVQMDFSSIPPAKLKEMEDRGFYLLRKLRAAGVDYWTERCEWSPALHTFLGGIWVDEDGRGPVPGLFAAGEAGGHARVFGADRVGTALLACLVFGHRAGTSAARDALAHGRQSRPPTARQEREALAELDGLATDRGADPGELRREIQRLAWTHLNVVRHASGLEEAAQAFRQLAGEPLRGHDLRARVAAMEARHLAVVGQMVARSALLRDESRGQHTRQDAPASDHDRWLRWTVLDPGDDWLAVDTWTTRFERLPGEGWPVPLPAGQWLDPVMAGILAQ